MLRVFCWAWLLHPNSLWFYSFISQQPGLPLLRGNGKVSSMQMLERASCRSPPKHSMQQVFAIPGYPLQSLTLRCYNKTDTLCSIHLFPFTPFSKRLRNYPWFKILNYFSLNPKCCFYRFPNKFPISKPFAWLCSNFFCQNQIYPICYLPSSLYENC